MNIKQAKQIELQGLVEHFGGRYSKQTKPDEIWFYSPFRPDERTASFKVNPQRNIWYDFATGTGGSTIDLWLDYNQQDRKSRDAIKGGLQGLAQFTNLPATLINQYRATARDTNKRDKKTVPVHANRFKLIKSPGRIWHGSLLQEIERRRLSLATVSPFVKQADILDTKTGNKLTGFAFQNDAFGWEISIPNPKAGKSFKTSIGKKAPSSFTNDAHEKALIFEGFWDYLTWMQMKKSTICYDIFILNSISLIDEVATQVKVRKNMTKSIFLYLDNDEAGLKGIHRITNFLEPEEIIVGIMNDKYKGYKDLNDYWVNRRLLDLNEKYI